MGNYCKQYQAVSEIAAAGIIAEISTNMEQFPNEQHLASWKGMSPGNKIYGIDN
ncbi:MAG TPA: hypothetical protein ENI76_06535 [Ignavibacteria bacterium]|nr:hypothetical protein [Ignavibacteria bacterium]